MDLALVFLILLALIIFVADFKGELMAKLDEVALAVKAEADVLKGKLTDAEARVTAAVKVLSDKVAELEAAAPNSATAAVLQSVIDGLKAEEVVADGIAPAPVEVVPPVVPVV